MGIPTKMSRYPIQDDTNFVLMTQIHQIHKISRLTITTRYRIVTGRLIAPRPIKRIFIQWHQLNMRVIHFFHIGNQPLRYFTIGKEFAVFLALP